MHFDVNNVNKPLIRTRSTSSSGLGQDHHLDSYPDTEEDDTDSSDNDNESAMHVNAATKQAVRKMPLVTSSIVSGNSTPVMSPGGSRTFDEHVQKVPQSLNMEHLHDSLRRSLTKGSDSLRTPIASSPAPIDNAEREKMVKTKDHKVLRKADTS